MLHCPSAGWPKFMFLEQNPNPITSQPSTFPSGPEPQDRARVAPVWHTVVFIVVTLGLAALQARQQPRLATLKLPSRTPLYALTMFLEFAMLAYVWVGLRITGKTVRDIIGGKWEKPIDLLQDVAVALGFWFVVVGMLVFMSFALGKNEAGLEAVKALLPRTAVEMVVWVCLSVTAGFCEEFIFRGYLQRQFLALTGKPEAAVALQAIIFGSAHAYQGWKGAVTITLYGALFGGLAAWRKSLRPGMIQHAAQDTFSGLVGSFILRHFPGRLG
jgi:uncharacterized protein